MNNAIEYIEVNGTSYHKETSLQIINILEDIRINHIRVKIDFGYVLTGKSWKEEFDTIGYIGRSMGTIKIPLLIYNNRSIGGEGLLDHCIVKITTTKDKKVLYIHPNYHI